MTTKKNYQKKSISLVEAWQKCLKEYSEAIQTKSLLEAQLWKKYADQLEIICVILGEKLE